MSLAAQQNQEELVLQKQEPALEKIDFFNLNIEDAEEKLGALLGKKFHGKSVVRYVYKHFFGIDQMQSLSAKHRELLKETLDISPLPVRRKQISQDGTVKFLFGVQGPKGAEEIEAVYIPDAERVTLCVSSQVGCKMGCKFCLTAQLGFKQHLSASDIVRQVYTVLLDPELRPVTNLVFMGMGEPFDNLEEVRKAITTLTHVRGLDMSSRKITVSTVGLVEKIDDLKKEDPFRLAVSMNATTDELRDRIMPVNRKWKLQDLMAACKRYVERTNKYVTFEYILMKDLTDRPEDAKRLIQLTSHVRCKINLIPYNESEFTEFKRPDPERVQAFHAQIMKAQIPVFTRKNRGNDIYAACGMLRKKQA